MAGPVVGVELADSGTRLVAAVDTARGARRWSTRLPEPPTATEAVAHLHALIARALADGGAAAEADGRAPVSVGVALAGQVDTAWGVVQSVRLAEGWEHFPLAAELASCWGGPVRLQTTIQAAALAEARLGAGRAWDNVCYLALGRSVAAGFVLGGQVYEGAHGRAGDLAHWVVRLDGPRCACGARGHLEPMASAQSLVRTMIGRAVDHPASNAAMLAITGGRAEAMTAEQVARLAAEGDPVAASVIGEAIEALAAALANVVAAWDPDVIVLGGPLAAAGAEFVEPLGQRMRALCQPFIEAPPLLAGELDPAAALSGAVLSARDAWHALERVAGE